MSEPFVPTFKKILRRNNVIGIFSFSAEQKLPPEEEATISTNAFLEAAA